MREKDRRAHAKTSDLRVCTFAERGAVTFTDEFLRECSQSREERLAGTAPDHKEAQ